MIYYHKLINRFIINIFKAIIQSINPYQNYNRYKQLWFIEKFLVLVQHFSLNKQHIINYFIG